MSSLHLKYQPKNKSVVCLLKDFERTHLEVFKKVRSDWSPRIREFLREETGFKFQSKRCMDVNHLNDAVEVAFKPDKNDLFVKLIDEKYPNLDFDEFSKLSKFSEQFAEASEYFAGKNELSHIEALRKYCDDYFRSYELKSIIENVFNIRESGMEVWGAYFCSSKKVELYYLPIILMCKLMNVQPEYSAAVVMAHELAHAYHHLGKDKDGLVWKEFSSTDKEITEGLAQFYTLRFVEEYEEQYPALRQAYNAMIAFQTGPYLVHNDWVKDFNNEDVRLAMVATRTSSIVKYKEFQELLKSAKEILHRKLAGSNETPQLKSE